MSNPNHPSPSERSRVVRAANRGIYDPATIAAIIDASEMCHVACIHNDAPVVIPMVHWRVDDRVYIHGATSSRLMKCLTQQAACLSFTVLDGFVLARSAFHHSMNYRSVVVHGRGTAVANNREPLYRAFLDKWWPGRYDEVRAVSQAENKATAIIAFPLDEASAKIRTGPPVDDPADVNRPTWAGVVPIHQTYGAPQADEHVPADMALPDYLSSTSNQRDNSNTKLSN